MDESLFFVATRIPPVSATRTENWGMGIILEAAFSLELGGTWRLLPPITGVTPPRLGSPG